MRKLLIHASPVVAAPTWEKLIDWDEALATTSYVLVERYALAQHRLDLDAVRTFAFDSDFTAQGFETV